MINNKIKLDSLLSTLWIFILLNVIFRDLHEFLAEGYIEKMMAQKVSELDLLFFGFLIEIPILMVLLSSVLNTKANKWANIIAAGIMILGLLIGLPEGDMDDIFFSMVNLGAFVVLLFTAWKLPVIDRQ